MSFDKFSHGILASPAHASFQPMEFGVCRIRKAWRNWRCGVVCLTLFDKAVYKCLHWFLLQIGYLCIDMHCKIRSCLDGRLYYLSLLFFLGARVSERQLVARESSQNRNTSLTTLIWKITGNHGNHGHFFRELHFGWTPGEMLLFSLAIVVIDAFQNTRRSKLSFGQLRWLPGDEAWQFQAAESLSLTNSPGTGTPMKHLTNLTKKTSFEFLQFYVFCNITIISLIIIRTINGHLANVLYNAPDFMSEGKYFIQNRSIWDIWCFLYI